MDLCFVYKVLKHFLQFFLKLQQKYNLIYYKLLLKAQYMIDPLLQIRRRVGLYSLQQSHQRIKKQQFQLLQRDQAEIDDQYDQLVYSNIAYQNIFTQYGDTSSVTRGKFSAKGQYFVTVGASGEGRVWQMGDDKSQNFGKQISELKAADKLYDVDIHPSIGNIPAFAPNIITGTANGQILVWTFDPLLKSQKSIKIKAHSDRVNNVRFHQTGWIFLAASYDKSWSMWDGNKIKQLCNQKGHNKQIHTLSLHPDGSLILTGDLGGDGMIWDLRTGKGIFQFSSNSPIVCSDFHPNGSQFCIGGKNNTINIYDLRRKKELKSIPAHLKLVSDLTYSKNGAILFSAGHDNIVKMWHGRSYCSVGSELQHPAKISSISHQDGKIGVTMLDRKWTIWSSKKTKIQSNQIKIEHQVENFT